MFCLLSLLLLGPSDSNLVANPSLQTLSSWNVVCKYDGAVAPDSNGTSISHNSDGEYYLSQQIKTRAGNYYKVSVTADYTLNNYYPVGVYVMDTAMKHVLGKVERIYSTRKGDNWQFVFFSGNSEPVKLVMGFLNGINGSATFRNVSVTKYAYRPDLKNSSFSERMAAKFPLQFDATSYDSTITRIGDYLNWVLLSDSMYCDAESEVVQLQNMFMRDSTHPYLDTCLHHLSDLVHGYCQKSSLCMAEVLTGDFHIPVRQVFMSHDGVGLHQFVEYWNPFSGKWVVIDLYFSARYRKNGSLLDCASLSARDAPGYIQRFGRHHFYPDTLELENDWRSLTVQEDGYYVISFPFQ